MTYIINRWKNEPISNLDSISEKPWIIPEMKNVDNYTQDEYCTKY